MKLSVYSPEKPLLTEIPVLEVIVPSVRGELGILPGHASLVSLLQKGSLRYLTASSSEFQQVQITEGYLEIEDGHIKVLAESAS